MLLLLSYWSLDDGDPAEVHCSDIRSQSMRPHSRSVAMDHHVCSLALATVTASG